MRRMGDSFKGLVGSNIQCWHRKQRGRKASRILVKCRCCDQKLEIYYDEWHMEIGGVIAWRYRWREVLRPIFIGRRAKDSELLRVWHRKGTKTVMSRYLMKCKCHTYEEGLTIYYDDETLEIGGVIGSISEWKKVLESIIRWKNVIVVGAKPLRMKNHSLDRPKAKIPKPPKEKNKKDCPKCKKGTMKYVAPISGCRDLFQCNRCGHQAVGYDNVAAMCGFF